MAWEVEYTDEFGAWWENLTEQEQGDVAAYVGVLERRGPMLPYPYSSGVRRSKHGAMRELRVQSAGKPIRIFYAFDLRRMAILLIGGRKAGVQRFYDKFIPIADRLYDEHIDELRAESEKERRHGRTTSVRGTSKQDVPAGAKPRRGKG
ncbi:MAG TPA: type II toxin-antitoxin system RelE/ParE family toxin [Patescibacteria group bacterium]|nr:type II toxin-antitoxin system RelE/ParE family toxin [Patescibacteria group bacterium]